MKKQMLYKTDQTPGVKQKNTGTDPYYGAPCRLPWRRDSRARAIFSCDSQIGERHCSMVKCGVTYGGGRSACAVSGCECGFCGGGKCTTRGAFCAAAANDARVGRCARDDSAAEDEAVESVDNVRGRSTGVCGCMGSVAAECADDVDGRRKIALEKGLPGPGDGVWTVRMLVGDVDVPLPGGGDEES